MGDLNLCSLLVEWKRSATCLAHCLHCENSLVTCLAVAAAGAMQHLELIRRNRELGMLCCCTRLAGLCDQPSLVFLAVQRMAALNLPGMAAELMPAAPAKQQQPAKHKGALLGAPGAALAFHAQLDWTGPNRLVCLQCATLPAVENCAGFALRKLLGSPSNGLPRCCLPFP